MKAYYKGPSSDHFDGVQFYNPWNRRYHSFWSFLRWRFQAKPKSWPKKVASLKDTPPAHVPGSTLRVSFVGHSTVLIQTENMNILTDPIWSERASPFAWLGPKRVAAPGISFDQLPKIDLILVTHNHYDHLDLPTLKKLWDRDQPLILAPLGNDVVIHTVYSDIVVDTLDWHQNTKIGNITVHLEPIQHWSARNLRDRDKALWGAFVIESPSGKIYFAGDTGYGTGDHFRKTVENFGPFRFAMLPIGACEPRWFMNYAHMNPEEAVVAHQVLNGPYTLAIHHATFQLADEGYDDPVRELASAKLKHQIKDEWFRALKVGEAWEVPATSLESQTNPTRLI